MVTTDDSFVFWLVLVFVDLYYVVCCLMVTIEWLRFDSQPLHFYVATLDMLFTHTWHVPLLPSSIIWYWSKSGDALWLGR